jgi:hypothetical protein
MRPRAPYILRTWRTSVFRWHRYLLGCIALGAIACGEVRLGQDLDAAPSDAAAIDAARGDGAPVDTPPDAAPIQPGPPDARPVTPGPCDPAAGPLALACGCSDDAECASGHCIDQRCCEDACDDGCASCNAQGLCETHPGRVLVSASPDRADPVRLAGQTISGEFYAFVETCELMDEVRFFYDGSAVIQTDTSVPYDLGGGGAQAAGHHSNVEYPKGVHALRVELVRAAAVVDTLQASFTMAPSEFDETILFSLEPLRSNPRPLAGTTVSGLVYIFLAPGPMPASQNLDDRIPVVFYLDDPQRTTPRRTESNPPYDLGGGNATATSFDTRNLSNGSHVVETVYVVDGVERSAIASFSVAN